jgi:FMN phosphatase YigB (HAD superfamily)
VIDTVLLDLGNVLVFHDNRLLFRRLGAHAGIGEEEVQSRIPQELWVAMNTGALDEEGIRAEVNRALGTRLGPEEFFEVFNSHFTVHDEVLPLVAGLLGRVRLGLLSNTNAIHARWASAPRSSPPRPPSPRSSPISASSELHSETGSLARLRGARGGERRYCCDTR